MKYIDNENETLLDEYDFLYVYVENIYIETQNIPNVDVDLISHMEYHSDCANYRVLFTEISRDTISE